MGLPIYGAGTNVKYQAKLTSGNPDEAGIAQGTAIGSGHVYSVNGVDCAGVAGSIEYQPTAPDLADLQIEGHIQFKADKGVFARDSGGTNELLDYGPVGGSMNTRFNLPDNPNTTDVRTGNVSNVTNFENDRADTIGRSSITQYQKPDQIECRQDYNTSDNVVSYWVDDFPISQQTLTYAADTAYVFPGSTFGGLAGTGQPNGYSVGDVQIQAKAAVWEDKTKSMLFLGDSFTTQGGYPDKFINVVDGAGRCFPTTQQKGLDQNGSPIASSKFNNDVGYLVNLSRQLYKAGIWVGNRNLADSQPLSETNANYAQASGGVYKGASGDGQIAMDRLDAAIADGYQPNYLVCGLGTNDAAANAGAPTDQQFEDGYKAIFDKAIDVLGVERIVIWTIPPLNNSKIGANYDTPFFDAETDRLNAVIDSLAGYRDKVFVVDMFTIFGGHTGYDPIDFQDDDIHPSENGSYKLGYHMGMGLVNAINTPIGTSPTLTTPYSTQYNKLNDVVNLDVSDWAGVDPNSYGEINLPVGLEISPQGLITGTIRMGGFFGVTITVTGTDGQKTSSGFNWYITFT